MSPYRTPSDIDKYTEVPYKKSKVLWVLIALKEIGFWVGATIYAMVYTVAFFWWIAAMCGLLGCSSGTEPSPIHNDSGVEAQAEDAARPQDSWVTEMPEVWSAPYGGGDDNTSEGLPGRCCKWEGKTCLRPCVR